jgi:AcrR family transcriptional regulator
MKMPMEGLRERKKREARAAIAETAVALFAERGFDAVTVVEVAAAAGVSAKTVFNYFPVKEDLVLDARQRIEEELLAAVAARSAGIPAIAAVRDHTIEVARRLDKMPPERRLRFRRVLAANPSIKARLRTLSLDTEQRLAGLLARQTRVGPDDPRPRLAAAVLVSLSHLAYGFEPGEGAPLDLAATTKRIERAFELVAEGLGGYAVSR